MWFFAFFCLFVLFMGMEGEGGCVCVDGVLLLLL